MHENIPLDSTTFHTLIRRMHGILFGAAEPEIAGRYRTLDEPVFFGGDGQHRMAGASPAEIFTKLDELFLKLRLAHVSDLSRRLLAREIAYFLEEFLAIHPFLDGNGRIARGFVTLMCRPTRWVFDPSPRNSARGSRSYVRALEHAHKHNATRNHPRRNPFFRDPLKPLTDWVERRLEEVGEISEANPPD